jgi:hypothetical protein
MVSKWLSYLRFSPRIPNQYTKEPIIDQTNPPKSPLTPPFQRGEFLPFIIVKGGKEGFRIEDNTIMD